MCGRTACTLNPDQISRAARYRNSRGRNVDPKWRKGDEDKFRPSYNKAPMSFCPVLFHASHLAKNSTKSVTTSKKDEDNQCVDNERIIASMKWGLLPAWVKESNQSQFKMNNARSDTMLTKASYKRPLEKGQRCVVLAEGFYEWNTTKTEKQPYFIYFKDNEIDEKNGVKDENGVKVEPSDLEVSESGEDVKNIENEVKDENGVKVEPSDVEASGQEAKKRILTMAGIFECKKSQKEDEDDLYTFSVITVDSHPAFSWLHHRMPAMLENEDEVRRWLNYGEVPLEEAVELIKPKDCLSWYPVSKVVNNSRNNIPECMEKIDLSKAKVEKMSSESKGMAKWLARSSGKVKEDPLSQDKKEIKQETKSPLKSSEQNQSPVKGQKSPKKGQKRQSSGSTNLMEGWLKKAKKE